MDPDELQEIGLFLLFGMIWVMLSKSKTGFLEGLINYILIGLFCIGIALVIYGTAMQSRRTAGLIRRRKGQ